MPDLASHNRICAEIQSLGDIVISILLYQFGTISFGYHNLLHPLNFFCKVRMAFREYQEKKHKKKPLTGLR